MLRLKVKVNLLTVLVQQAQREDETCCLSDDCTQCSTESAKSESCYKNQV